MKRGRYVTRRSQLESNRPFCVERLRNVFEKNVLLGPKGRRTVWIMPTDGGLQRLSNILNNWHDWFFAAQEQRKLNEAKKAAEEAFKSLRSVLPTLGNYYNVAANRGDQYHGDQFARWQMQATALIAACVGLRWDERTESFGTDDGLMRYAARIIHRDKTPEVIFGWQWLIDVLPKDFATAMATANRTAIGISDDGPLARFIAAVVPIITGESPTAATVKRQLSARQKSASVAKPT